MRMSSISLGQFVKAALFVQLYDSLLISNNFTRRVRLNYPRVFHLLPFIKVLFTIINLLQY